MNDTDTEPAYKNIFGVTLKTVEKPKNNTRQNDNNTDNDIIGLYSIFAYPIIRANNSTVENSFDDANEDTNFDNNANNNDYPRRSSDLNNNNDHLRRSHNNNSNNGGNDTASYTNYFTSVLRKQFSFSSR